VGLRFAGGGSFGQRLASVGDLLAGLLEDIFQLLINTLSFVRVGAFALAHAGLSSAVISLAGMSDALSLQLLTLVLGNLFVTGLEGLVVSIQTTRLVLFEFFRRFLHTGGRPFRPLLPPESVQVGTA
jgi:V/A-type H+-transporting ATPase subunit I